MRVKQIISTKISSQPTVNFHVLTAWKYECTDKKAPQLDKSVIVKNYNF